MQRVAIVLVAALASGSSLLRAQIYQAQVAEDILHGGGELVPVLPDRMTPAAFAEFAHGRTTQTPLGSLLAFSSLLWSLERIGLWCDDEETLQRSVENTFQPDYEPTWLELMDVLARQTQCGLQYHCDTGYWHFEPGIRALPFVLEPAPGWKSRDDGNSIVFIPPIAPVGMDVYMLGHYSTDDAKQTKALYRQAREHVALSSARRFTDDVSLRDFKKTKVARADALFWTTRPGGRPQATWRQWAFVIEGWSFLIVSLIDDADEKQLLPAVQGMVASFQLAPDADHGLEPPTTGDGPDPQSPAVLLIPKGAFSGPRGPRSMWSGDTIRNQPE